MSVSKHTPGPWLYECRDGDHPKNNNDGWGCVGLWSPAGDLIFGLLAMVEAGNQRGLDDEDIRAEVQFARAVIAEATGGVQKENKS